MNAPAVRRDALPEHVNYRDDGCSIAPSCLACPLERCRYDGGHPLHVRADERRRQILELMGKGWSMTQIAEHIGVSRRQAFRLRKAAA